MRSLWLLVALLAAVVSSADETSTMTPPDLSSGVWAYGTTTEGGGDDGLGSSTPPDTPPVTTTEPPYVPPTFNAPPVRGARLRMELFVACNVWGEQVLMQAFINELAAVVNLTAADIIPAAVECGSTIYDLVFRNSFSRLGSDAAAAVHEALGNSSTLLHLAEVLHDDGFSVAPTVYAPEDYVPPALTAAALDFVATGSGTCRRLTAEAADTLTYVLQDIVRAEPLDGYVQVFDSACGAADDNGAFNFTITLLFLGEQAVDIHDYMLEALGSNDFVSTFRGLSIWDDYDLVDLAAGASLVLNNFDFPDEVPQEEELEEEEEEEEQSTSTTSSSEPEQTTVPPTPIPTPAPTPAPVSGGEETPSPTTTAPSASPTAAPTVADETSPAGAVVASCAAVAVATAAVALL